MRAEHPLNRNWEPIDARKLGYYDFTVHKYETFVPSLQGGFKSVDMNSFPPPHPREFCPLLFQKALEMIDQSESV